MTTNETIETLKNKGFEVQAFENGCSVRLNRPISSMEIEIALDFQIEQEHFIRCSASEIFITGIGGG
jgi:hypothetical protein